MKRKTSYSLHPTLTTLLGHHGGNIQLKAAQHHAGAKELSVHGLSAEIVQVLTDQGLC